MKKLFVMIAGMGLSIALPQAAHAMDCCKDGKCACCTKDDDASAPDSGSTPQD